MTETIQKASNILPLSYVSALSEGAHLEKAQLCTDYGFEPNEFEPQIQKESYLSRVLSYRFCSSARMLPILDCLRGYLSETNQCGDWFFAPLIYLRFCYPGLFLSEKHKKTLLYTEPHYDRCHGFRALSFWVPFKTANEQTGGLCDFPGVDLTSEFPRGGKNRFSVGAYLDHYHEVDDLIAPYVRQPLCEEGSVLYFEHSVLHGATKPTSKLRLSMNFQLVDWRSVGDAPDAIVNSFELFRENMDVCNIINLFYLRDFIGARRYLEQLNVAELRLSSKLGQALSAILNKLEDAQGMPGIGKMHWTEEYAWLAKN